MTFSQLYHQEIEELAALAYRDALKGLTAEQIDRGCREAIKRCTFIPKPADILECIHDTRESYPLLALPGPSMSKEEAKEFFALLRREVPWAFDPEKKPDMIVEITDEMRARLEEKKQEALKRFGT